MAAVSINDCVVHEQFTGVTTPKDNPLQIKWFAVEMPSTTDATDTLAMKLSDYGITTLWDVMAWTHTTNDNIIVTESTEIATAVSSGTLTVTIQAGSDDKKRVILVGGV